MAANIQALEAENALLREALFGKYGVTSGIDIIEKCLAKAVKAEHEDAPFPLDEAQAKLWHRAQMEAFRHALEMISVDPELAAKIEAAKAVKAEVSAVSDGQDVKPEQAIPMAAIGAILNQVMEQAVANGANSVSMPDEYVAVAHFVAYPEKYAVPPAAGHFTVIGHNEYSRELFVEHVVARDGLNAFAVAAARQPDAEFSVAIAGTLTDENSQIMLPGEGLVCTGTIVTQPDVFGVAEQEADEPGGP
jgi:hypothetical protein